MFIDITVLIQEWDNNYPGYCVILKWGEYYRVIEGDVTETTYNRGTLQTLVKAIKEINRPSKIRINSTSQYIVDSIKFKNYQKWFDNGWSLDNGQRVANSDLWQELKTELDKHKYVTAVHRSEQEVKNFIGMVKTR